MATSSTKATVSQNKSRGLKQHFMEKLMTKIFCFYDEQSLIDVTFKVLNPASFVPAHRLILSAASPYFENLFNGDLDNTPVIEINDIDSDIFERLITFCYTGQTLVTVGNVAAMLKAAIVLQLEDAATTCVEFLMAHINECNLQGVYALERETENELLKLKIHEYEIQNFMEVEKLQCLLESDNLSITCEEDAYGAITRWFNHDVSARQEHLPRLIDCLRLTQFDVDFLLTHIQSLPGCELLAFMASTWISNPAVRSKINIRHTLPRVGVNNANRDERTLLVVYKEDMAQNPCILQYNKAENKWQTYESINKDSINRSAILKDNNIFLTGEDLYKSPSKTVLCWNITNKIWRELPEMNEARYAHCVVELECKIYAIGGHGNGNTFLDSVERYTTSNGWEIVDPLITPRCCAGVVTLNGKIYVMGGSNKNRLKSVECYTPDSNTWASCADMTNYHSKPAVAAYHGHIYVVGDYWHQNCRNVERYDPLRNTWSKICSLDGGWCGISCASLDKKLWTIGGRGGSENETRVAVYDEETDRWVQKSSLPKGFIYSCFVVPVSLLTSK
ncbi:kelch-like protein diablo isoform X2 [Zeugodacus cucurbitae]|uniref:kelch-like protein diablo isoform X2 n=1 Tax=Zeugodacus cucurbitae TaxID=28588 RepID=UPI0023D8FAF0|nr:kelch-like protein diablo isoform X2 [Zeugodacus cucurbitae]